jgi:hypothetical protein
MSDHRATEADFNSLPKLEVNEGTVFISKTTDPRKAAWAGMSLLELKKEVQFVFISESPSHIAMKVCGILSNIFDHKWQGEFVLLFRPLRFRTFSAHHKKEIEAQGWMPQVIDLKLLNEKSSR